MVANEQLSEPLVWEDIEASLRDTSWLGECFEAFTPRVRTRFTRWCVDNIYNDEGRPYDHGSYPHIGAPGGPGDAIDCPSVRTIAPQFGTRLGKSFCGQNMLLYFAAVDPAPMMFASQSRESAEGVMSRMYKQIYYQPSLNALLAKAHQKDHKKSLIECRDCWIRGAWAASPGSLADWNITYGVANEIDKPGWFIKSTSKEGAPIKLFEERFKDNQSIRKVYLECTPTFFGESEIERRRLMGWNAKYYVPCPHCSRYQQLRLAHRDDEGEYDWERPGRLAWEGGVKASTHQVRQTAHYICEHCSERIENHHRHKMMRAGVWVPDGCEVDDARALAAATLWFDDLVKREPGAPIRFKGWEHADWIKARLATMAKTRRLVRSVPCMLCR